MDITRLSNVMEVLRRQLSEATHNAEHPATGAVTEKNSGTSTNPSRKLSSLKLRIQERIGDLDPADPQQAGRSQRVFIESILAWEFGDEIMSDRGFENLVEQIRAAMTNQPDINNQLSRFIAGCSPGKEK